ncbi:hypothetical protein H632_c192p2 [Helicosporidium sp. ATCC 50920]|nr:hypothetical protein H632_c192p2 [Helicosporidium sp. ATCC 50920]|eukprot:KDD76534.1 hypothetical protein H632_c192p2 [Helicosporidium sp. ATCC 50920]
MTLHLKVEVRLDAGHGKGKGVFATEEIKTGEVVFTEPPLCAIQHADNRRHVPACQECFCLLAALPDAQVVSCEHECGQVYCSPSCRAAAWDRHHAALCPASPAPGPPGAKSRRGENVATRPEALDLLHLIGERANDAVFLVLRMVAGVKLRAERWAAQRAEDEGAGKRAQAAAVLSDQEAWEALREGWRPLAFGAKQLWWELPLSGEDVTEEERAECAQDRKTLCSDVASLLSLALNLDSFPALADVRVVGALLGMIELNNLGLVVAPAQGDEAGEEGEENSRDAGEEETSQDLGSSANVEEEKEAEPLHARHACCSDEEHAAPMRSSCHEKHGTCHEKHSHSSCSSDEGMPVVEGTAFSPLHACCNHSCMPNAHAFKRSTDQDGTTVILALQDIAVGEEIELSYIDEDAPLQERRAALQEYGFLCQCVRANSVTLIGFVGKPPLQRTIPGGKKLTTFSIALPKLPDQSTPWYVRSGVLVEAWNQMATVADQVQKGMQIQVQGKFKVNNYTDPNNTIHRNFSVVAFSLSQVRRTEGGKAREDGGFAAAGGDRAPKDARSRGEIKARMESAWMRYFENPSDWVDHRAQKQRQEVNARFPDFRRLTKAQDAQDVDALWVESAPDWVPANLPPVDA